MCANEMQEYIINKKEIYLSLINFIECEEERDKSFISLIDLIKKHKILENPIEFKEFLYLINIIYKHHYRCSNFIDKIYQIIKYIESDIKQTLSNFDIFNIFKKDKLILLFMFQNYLLTIDNIIINYFLNKKEQGLYLYFYPEIKDYLEIKDRESIEKELLEKDPDIFTKFDKKRQIGENDSYICTLIRNDSVEQFVEHVSKLNISLSSDIQPSPFETHNFLMKEEGTRMIEYAAFFGSIKIFRYLEMNGVGFDKFMMILAIHSNSESMIYHLEETLKETYDINDDTEKTDLLSYLNESIKCHNGNLTTYFLNKYDGEKEDIFDINFYTTICKYHNYQFFPDDSKIEIMYQYFFCFSYTTLIKYLVKDNEAYLNDMAEEIFENQFLFMI